MKIIKISEQDHSLVKKYAPSLDLGGFSNLNSNDLSKATREDYQYTGLFGELAWHLFRYNSLDLFIKTLDIKNEICTKTKTGDNGYDDSVDFNEKTRLIDVKSSFIYSKDKIKNLNLIVPLREYHTNMIYVAAFTLGTNRRNISEVYLTGWCFNEDLKDYFDNEKKKLCRKTINLRNMNDLKEYL